MRQNRLKASVWCAWIASTFRVATVADWIILSSHLPETPENREFGLECDKALIERCDELWLCGEVMSSGMAIEAEHARRSGLSVWDFIGVPMGRDRFERVMGAQGRCVHCGEWSGICNAFTDDSKCCPD